LIVSDASATIFLENTASRAALLVGDGTCAIRGQDCGASYVRLIRGIKFVRNIGHLYSAGIRANGAVFMEISGDAEFVGNDAWCCTGIFGYLGAHIVIRGDVSIHDNFAPVGGTLLASSESIMELHDGVRVHDNMMTNTGYSNIVSDYGSILVASGTVSMENNVALFGSGGIFNRDASVFLGNGVSVSYNVGSFGGAGICDVGEDPHAGVIHMDSVSISHNVAYVRGFFRYLLLLLCYCWVSTLLAYVI